MLRLGIGKLLFDLFRVFQALGDPLAAHFQHIENRTIGKAIQQRANKQEADDIGEKQRPVEAKLFAGLASRLEKTFEKARGRS